MGNDVEWVLGKPVPQDSKLALGIVLSIEHYRGMKVCVSRGKIVSIKGPRESLLALFRDEGVTEALHKIGRKGPKDVKDEKGEYSG